MGLKHEINTRIIEKLPRNIRFFIERSYIRFYPSGSHLRGDLSIIRRLSSTDKAALDIGASYGAITLFLCKYASHVYAFEPIPIVAKKLSQRFAGLNVTIENCGLGSVESEMILNIPCIGGKKYFGWSSLAKNFDNEIIQEERVATVEKIIIKVKRLDDFNLGNIGFIKIDVEGYELEVLRGGEKTIRSEMPILFVEIERRHHRPSNAYDVISCLEEWGYSAYFVRGSKLISIDHFNFEIMQDEKSKRSKSYLNDFVFRPM